MISFIEVPIGVGDAVSCARCEPSPVPAAPSDFDDIAPRIDAAIAMGRRAGGAGPNLRFAGYEPFLHPELPALVSAAAQAGAARIQLRTDGGGLAQPGNAPGALEAGVTHFEVVLLGGDAETHDGISGTPGLFEACEQGVRTLMAAARASGERIAVTGAVPMCLHNLAQAAQAVAALAEMGALAVRLEVSASAAASVGLSAALSAALDTGTVNGVWVSVAGVAPESLPVSALHAVAPFAIGEVAR